MDYGGWVAGYGQLHNDNKISVLNSEYLTQYANGTLHATGLYHFKNFQIRPQPLVSFSHFRNPTYYLSGILANNFIQVTRENENFNFGYAEFKVEGNYTLETKGNVVQPYAEIGGDYVFSKPNDSQIYSGNLAFANISPMSGLATLGVRALLSKKLLIQTSGSYLSFGQDGIISGKLGYFFLIHLLKGIIKQGISLMNKILYTCPMHPEIVRNHPGSCPICGMALEPKAVSKEATPNEELMDMSRRFWISVVLCFPF